MCIFSMAWDQEFNLEWTLILRTEWMAVPKMVAYLIHLGWCCFEFLFVSSAPQCG